MSILAPLLSILALSAPGLPLRLCTAPQPVGTPYIAIGVGWDRINPDVTPYRVIGEVSARVRVGADGKPLEVRIVRADSPRYEGAAQVLLGGWAFTPAQCDGVSAEGWARVRVPVRAPRR